MLTVEQVQALEVEHKRVRHVVGQNGAWEVVLRKPMRAEYKRFRAMAQNAGQAADAQEMLARATVVYPTKESFDALLEDYPAIPEACAPAMAELAGINADESAKF